MERPDKRRDVSQGEATQDVEEVVDRVQGEYREMPGLRLTTDQAQRLLGLDPDTCEKVLDRLVDEMFLARTSDGSYVRSGDRQSE
jgi:hypothetical protein